MNPTRRKRESNLGDREMSTTEVNAIAAAVANAVAATMSANAAAVPSPTPATNGKGKKAQAAPKSNGHYALPNGITENDTEYLIHVPKAWNFPVSNSGKTRAIKAKYTFEDRVENACGAYVTFFKPL
jgi:hypothetical protein